MEGRGAETAAQGTGKPAPRERRDRGAKSAEGAGRTNGEKPAPEEIELAGRESGKGGARKSNTEGRGETAARNRRNDQRTRAMRGHSCTRSGARAPLRPIRKDEGEKRGGTKRHRREEGKGEEQRGNSCTVPAGNEKMMRR